jgi:hypothetical protein
LEAAARGLGFHLARSGSELHLRRVKGNR